MDESEGTGSSEGGEPSEDSDSEMENVIMDSSDEYSDMVDHEIDPPLLGNASDTESLAAGTREVQSDQWLILT